MALTQVLLSFVDLRAVEIAFNQAGVHFPGDRYFAESPISLREMPLHVPEILRHDLYQMLPSKSRDPKM